MSWLKRLQKIAAQKVIRVAGLMSGTSADGIDVAICDFTVESGGYGGHSLIAFDTVPYESKLSKSLRAAESLTARTAAELDMEVGAAFGSALRAVCLKSGVPLDSINLIASHGQTVYHHSGASKKASLQLGCGDSIAQAAGLPVAFDFRRKDLVLGGEGAPLTPFADFFLYGGAEGRALLNLGGIANLTLFAKSLEDVWGFDTGPANAPLDRLAAILTNGRESFDRDGKLAAAGVVDKTLLNVLLDNDAYLKKAPPKSTGFEAYGDSFVRYLLGLHKGTADVHLIATVTEFVAASIARALTQFARVEIRELVIAGGGARNPSLVKALERAVTPLKIIHSDVLGIPADAREAMGFALLGLYALLGNDTSLPKVTGASKSACLGKFALP